MAEKIKEKEKTAEGLEKPQCGGAQCEYSDITLDSVTYRVWSAFVGKEDASRRLSDLMLRSVNSGEEVGEVVDWRVKEIERIYKETEEVARLARSENADDETVQKDEGQNMNM